MNQSQRQSTAIHKIRCHMDLPKEPEEAEHVDSRTAMQKVGLIDIQTDTVSASTMVYTEGLEMFTSLTVEFSFDYAGNVEGRAVGSTFVFCSSSLCFCLFLLFCILSCRICAHGDLQGPH